MLNNPSSDEIVEMFRKMVVVRAIEERLGELHKQGKTRGPLHRCDGQEAVGVGATAALRPNDVITSTHRGHAHYIGKGCEPYRVIAEIFGRASGYCRGRAGHMLVASAEHGLLGGNAIVGAGIPIAVGQALAFQLDRSERIALTFFGDGAAQTGVCHEAMNIAALWKLPVIFVCEHNEYGLTVPAAQQSSVRDLAIRAQGYAMPGMQVDGNDAVAVYTAVAMAAAPARRGEGPSFIEARTYRMVGFSTSDLGGYQPDSEIEAWRPKDPIARLRAVLAAEARPGRTEALEAAARKLVDESFERALADPLPDPAELAAGEYIKVG